MSDRQHVARLTSTPTEFEASLLAAALEDQGIHAVLSGQYTAGFRAEAPGWVQILVAEDDLAQAREVLANVAASRGDIDWSQVDVGEPEDL